MENEVFYLNAEMARKITEANLMSSDEVLKVIENEAKFRSEVILQRGISMETMNELMGYGFLITKGKDVMGLSYTKVCW